MTPENFEFVTKINYNAYFYCAQAASRVMKLQNKYCEENYCDIIQINSKSGLPGVESQLRLCGRQIRRYRPHAIVRPRAGAVPHQSERRLPR